MAPPAKPRRRRWLIAVGLLALLVALAVWAVRGFGRWLVVSDPLEPARAIVVLAGEVPYRAEEAAKLYHQKLAPEIWLTLEPPDTEMQRLDVGYHDKTFYDQLVLTKLGVPAAAIRIMPKATHNTDEEEIQILQQLKVAGADRVILVTSPFHTRRVRVIWHQLTGNSPRAIVHPANDEPDDVNHWWHNPDDLKAVGHEFFGLLNAWIGYPIHYEGAD